MLFLQKDTFQEVMNEDGFLQLVEEKKKPIFPDASSALMSTENGGIQHSICVQVVKDDLPADLNAEEVNSIQYHVKAYYKSYIL